MQIYEQALYNTTRATMLAGVKVLHHEYMRIFWVSVRTAGETAFALILVNLIYGFP